VFGVDPPEYAHEFGFLADPGPVLLRPLLEDLFLGAQRGEDLLT
jgi:hypothetical protein